MVRTCACARYQDPADHLTQLCYAVDSLDAAHTTWYYDRGKTVGLSDRPLAREAHGRLGSQHTLTDPFIVDAVKVYTVQCRYSAWSNL